MNQSERQKMFKDSIKELKKSAAFADAMSEEQVTRATALTLFQLTEESHRLSCKLLDTLGGDTAIRL